MTEKKERDVFVRKASGLVRVLGPFETMFFNILFSAGLGFTTAYFIVWALGLTYGGIWTFVLGVIICTILTIVQNFVWAFFSVAMPRTGGDYVYTSRTLHPAIGFAANWSWAFWLTWWLNWATYLVAYVGGTAILTNLAIVTGSPDIWNMASAAATPEMGFIIGSIAMFCFYLLSISPIKVYARVQNIAVVISLLGLVIALALLGISTQSGFEANFNQIFAEITGVSNPYQNVIDTATGLGFDPTPHFSWAAVALAVAYCAWTMYWSWGTAYFGAEIREVKRTQIFAMSSAPIFTGLFTILLALGLFKVCGFEFLSSSSWLYLNQPDAWFNAIGGLPIEPYFYFFVLTLTQNPILIVIMGVGFTLFGCWYAIENAIVASRCVFAWSFDRVFPSKLSSLSARFRTPWITLSIIFAFGELSLFFYAFYPVFSIVGGILGIFVQSYVLMVSGMVFPFRRKELFERSPISYKIGGVPVMSILGLLGFMYNTWLFYVFMTEPILGVAFDPVTLGAFFGVILLGLVIFYISKWYRKKEGLPLDLTFKELPPE